MNRAGRWAASATAVVVTATGLAWNTPGPAVAAVGDPVVTRLSDTRMDASALYFVSYDGLVNNASFQTSAIVTHAGYQYAAWYTSNRSAVLGRRQLPSGGGRRWSCRTG